MQNESFKALISANLVPVIGPKYCSHRTTPMLNKIPTIKSGFIDPSFFSLAAQP